MASIMSWMHSFASKAVIGFTITLLMLFALSLLVICIWMINWQVFVLAGTSIGWFLVACAYAGLCVWLYEPYIRWFDRFIKVTKIEVPPPLHRGLASHEGVSRENC